MKKIMIIEDDKDLREIYRINFENAGWQVIEEKDGLDGISKVIDTHPDIILLDIEMPNMDGFEFLKVLNENTDIDDIPVVVCSNLVDHDSYKRAITNGAVTMLSKIDHTPKEIVEKVGHIVHGVSL